MKTRIIFFGSDNYSQVVESALRRDKRFVLVNSLEDKPEVGIIASYGRIITNNIINSIPKGILNVHPSLLPKYRGPTPVQTAIVNGEAKTGVTIFKIDEEIDHGPILAQAEEVVWGSETAESLYLRLFKIGAELLLRGLPDYLNDQVELKAQDHSQATFTKKLSRNSGFIPITAVAKALKGEDFASDGMAPLSKDLFITEFHPLTPEEIERIIRAFYPWPGSWTLLCETDPYDILVLKTISLWVYPAYPAHPC